LLEAPAEGTEPARPVVAGYDILEVLGRGGMGVVYKAQQTGLNRLVALKMILAGAHAGPEELARFRTEAESVARLQHPNIVLIHAIGEQNGLPYFALEFVEGGSLQKKLNSTPQEPREAARLVETLARAVHAAHQRGIIHRDLKPANVLLAPDGTPKIADFGLAKQLDDDSAQTRTGQVLGTPSYMAPEQAAGRLKEVGARTDVYALGGILYEALTGRPPFKGATVRDTLEQVLSQEPVPPSRLQPKVPADLETICLKSLQKEGTRRYGTALDLAEDLRRFQDGEPIKARPTPAWERTWKWVRRRPALSALLAVSLLALLASVGAIVNAMHSARLNESLQEESRQRKEAGTQKDIADEQRARAEGLTRKLRYLADMFAARDALDSGGAAVVLELLERHRPAANVTDYRGFEWYYLWRQCHLDRRTLRGKMAPVHSLAYSADGQTLVVGCRDGQIHLWNLAKDKHVVLEAHKLPVLSLAFSSDDKLLASGCGSLGPDDPPGQVKVWDLATRKVLATLDAHKGGVNAVAFSADDKLLASGSGDGTVRIWEPVPAQAKPALWQEARQLRVWAKEKVTALAFSPKGNSLAVGSDVGLLRVWDTQTWQIADRGDPHKGNIFTLAFAPDAKQIASGGFDSNVVLWSLEKQTTDNLKAHTGGVFGLAYSRDGKLLATAGADQTVVLWDIQAKQGPRRRMTFKGHQGAVQALAFAPDGKTLASGGVFGANNDAGEVKIWDVTTDRADESIKQAQAGIVFALAFSPDGKTLASGSLDRIVKLSDPRTGKEQLAWRDHDDMVFALGYSADGKILAAGGSKGMNGGVLRFWDVVGKKERKVIDFASPVHCLAISPDSKILAAGCADSTVKLVDLATDAEVAVLKGHKEPVRCLAFTADGKMLASGSQDSTTILWDFAARKERRTLKGHTSTVWSVAFTSDGQTLATASADATAKLWDVTTGKEMATCRGHHREIRALAIDPKGKRLATASGDHTVKLWDLSSGELMLTLRGSDHLWSLAFSPDGKTLAAGNHAGSIHLWRAATEAEVRAKKLLRSDKIAAVVPPANQDHAVAAWAAKIGADGMIKLSNGQFQLLTSVTGQPATPLELLQLKFSAKTKVTLGDSDLNRLGGLAHLQSLVLDQPITDAGLAQLQNLPKLTSLELGPATKVTDAGLAQLQKNLPSLQSLSLNGSKISDAGLAHLQGLPKLNSLGLGPATKVTDAGLAQLEKLPSLRFLNLSSSKITGAGLAKLKKLPKLSTLSLNNSSIDDTGLAYLNELPALYWLILDSTKVTDAGLPHLLGVTNLRILSLRNTPITSAGLKTISQLKTINSLSLSGPEITDDGLAHLKGLTTLVSLTLQDTNITDTGLKHLQAIPGLTMLDLLKTNKVSKQGIQELRKALPKMALVDPSGVFVQSESMKKGPFKLDPTSELVGKAAADIKGEFTINGEPKKLSELKGKVVLLDFWAVWCGPCVDTFPHLRDWHKEFSKDGLEIVGVTTYHEKWAFNKDKGQLTMAPENLKPEAEHDMVKNFITHHKLDHRIMIVSKDNWNAAGKAYAVQGIPEAVLIDRKGVIRMIKVGATPQNAKDLHKEIKKLLAEK
jgi:WD40 repeat protein/thiol-disulfide isomerase/thioredoxin